MKPSFDVLLFTSHLARFFGSRDTVLLFINYCVTAKILRAVTLALGCLAAVEDRLEGQYRAGVGRVGRESEEVALYDGGVRERDILTRAYLRLTKHVNRYTRSTLHTNGQDFIIKYLCSAAGYSRAAAYHQEALSWCGCYGWRVRKSVDDSRRVTWMGSFLPGRKPTSPTATFSSPSQTQVGDSCAHIKICRRLLG